MWAILLSADYRGGRDTERESIDPRIVVVTRRRSRISDRKGSFDMWGSGQEIVSRVRATGVKQGNRKLSLSLFEDFRPVFIYVGT